MYAFSYNAVSWSISTEMGFYLLFPFLLRLSWPLKLAIPAALVVAAIAICEIFALPPYDGRNVISNFAILYFHPLVRLFEFAMGMCCALIYVRTRHYLGNSILLWTLAEVAAVSAFLWYVFVERGVLFYYAKISIAPVSLEYLIHASFGPFFALIILALSGEKGLLARFLGLAPLVFLGKISFSLYMVHQILITTYVQHAMQLPFAVVVAIMIAVSSTIHLLIEDPARRMIVGAFDGFHKFKLGRDRASAPIP